MKRLYIGAAILKMMEGLPSLFMSRRFLVHAFTTAQPRKHHDFRVQSKSMPNEDENVRSLSALMSLEDLSQESEARFYEKCPRPLGKRTINTWISREQCKILFDPSRRITNHVV